MVKSNEKKVVVPSLEVEILSIMVDSRISVCHNEVPVQLPNWEPCAPHKKERDPKTDTWLNDGFGSQRPGVFEISDVCGEQSGEVDISKLSKILELSKEVKTLDNSELTERINASIKHLKKAGTGIRKGSTLIVEVKVTNPTAFTTATLIGELGEMKFTGTIKGKTSSSQIVEVVSVEEPTAFRRIWGDMEWYISYNNIEKSHCVKPEKTRMEIFWIYGQPLKMFKRGVWIEVLRLIHLECGDLDDKKQFIRRIVNYCHSGTGLRYDSLYSACYYGLHNNGGAFSLKAYLAKTYPFCNCFDQAGALQTFLGALGIKVAWILMEPFGYIRVTNLVGRGLCNNPIFLQDNHSELIPADDPKRSYFGNHAFCIWKNDGLDFVLDGCAGPHFSLDIKKTFVVGYKQSYINATIDGTTALYNEKESLSNPGGLRSMVEDCNGVIDVKSISSTPFDPEVLKSLSKGNRTRIKEFKDRFGIDEAGKNLVPDEGVVFNWSDPLDWTGLSEISWIKSARRFEDFRVGLDAALKHWCYIGENECINIEIYVAGSIEPARNRLTLLALSSPLPKPQIKLKHRKQTLGELHLYNDLSPYYTLEKWWYYNICVDIVAYNPGMDLSILTEQIQEKAKACSLVRLPDYIPVIKSVRITFSSGESCFKKIKVGETITVEAEAELNPPPAQEGDPHAKEHTAQDLMLEFFIKGDSVIFVKEKLPLPGEKESGKKFEITFRAQKPGMTKVQLVLADRETLLSSTPWGLTVNVD